jgi:hypothetical protein
MNLSFYKIEFYKNKGKRKMFRNFLRKNKHIKLGRWNTNKTNENIDRQIDLANCDSCGTCDINNHGKKTLNINVQSKSIRHFSSNFSFQNIITKCYCFGDKREIRKCLCMSDFYSEKNIN